MSRAVQPAKDSRRREAVFVLCPTCGALPKFLCVGTRGNIRTAIHRDRYDKTRGQVPA